MPQTNEAPPPLPTWAIPACRLWARASPFGLCLSGRLGGVKVLVWPNPDRRDDNDAQYVLCLARSLPQRDDP